MRNRGWLLTVLVAGAFALPGVATAKTYKVDKDHSTVNFKVKHLFSNVNGRFDKFDGTIVFDPADPTKVKVEGTIDAASINTNLTKRDEHLRSPDFFDVKKYPTITYVATTVSGVDPQTKTGKLEGTLTMHGVTKPVVIEAAYLGEGKDPWGNMKAGFSGTTKLNRKDFGLTWNQALETGGWLVGEEVEIEINVEALAQ